MPSPSGSLLGDDAMALSGSRARCRERPAGGYAVPWRYPTGWAPARGLSCWRYESRSPCFLKPGRCLEQTQHKDGTGPRAVRRPRAEKKGSHMRRSLVALTRSVSNFINKGAIAQSKSYFKMRISQPTGGRQTPQNREISAANWAREGLICWHPGRIGPGNSRNGDAHQGPAATWPCGPIRPARKASHVGRQAESKGAGSCSLSGCGR